MVTEAPSLYTHIGCCVDDSAAAQGALEEAVRLRALGPGRLSVAHAAAPPTFAHYGQWSPPPASFLEAARAWLDALVATTPGAEAVLLWGDPATCVQEWARESHCDLLVAAAHGGPVERAVLGSFSRHLAHHAPCPVLFTRPRAPSAIAAAVDQSGELFADGEHGMSPNAAWTPEHLLLAAIARRAVKSLRHRAAVEGHEVRGRATASADLGGHATAPSLDAVWVGVDVDVDPPPEPDALDALLTAAERDTNWAIPLARRVRFAWRVNGTTVER
jgi:nucleotide-binding universal stress UspA family protein